MRSSVALMCLAIAGCAGAADALPRAASAIEAAKQDYAAMCTPVPLPGIAGPCKHLHDAINDVVDGYTAINDVLDTPVAK